MTDQGDGFTAVGATETTFAIVDGIAERQGEVGVTELAEHLDIPKSTVYKHLRTLADLGYVEQRDGAYALGVRFADLGEAVKCDTRLYHASKPYVDQLANLTDEVVGLVVESEGLAVDLYRTYGDRENETYATNAKYLHCSAPGKAILAQFPEARVEAIVDRHGLPELTEHTVTGPKALHEECERIGERGIAFEREEQRIGIRGVAVPIQVDDRVGAIYVSGSTDRLSSKRLEEDVPGMVLSTVKKIHASL